MRTLRLFVTFAATALLAPLAAQADEKSEDFDRSPIDCINRNSIDRTDIIDDQTIVFFMRGKKQIYVNHLPDRCPNLESSDRFTYRSTASRLSRFCKIDGIVVMPKGGGASFSCKLGQFTPVSAEEAAELRAIDDHGERPGAEPTPAALPKNDPAAPGPEQKNAAPPP